MNGNKTFVHRKLQRGDNVETIDSILTIYYHPWFRYEYNAYDFEITRVIIQVLDGEEIVETVVDQKGDENLQQDILEIAFDTLWEDGIIEDLMGNHFRFQIADHINKDKYTDY